MKLNCEPLEVREVPASAVFNTSVLTITGNTGADILIVAADASGRITVTDGFDVIPIRVANGSPPATTANLNTITIDAGKGDDFVLLDRSLNLLDANGKLASAPDAVIHGGKGSDTIRVLSGGFVGGVVGNAVVGNTVLFGDEGNDFLDSGFGNDVLFGGAGNDTMRWLPGTLNDAFDGGAGTDTAIVVGNDGQGDAFRADRDPLTGGVLFQRTNLVPFSIQITNTEALQLLTGSGDDTVTVTNLKGTGVQSVLVDGGAGNDVIDVSGAKVKTKVRC